MTPDFVAAHHAGESRARLGIVKSLRFASTRTGFFEREQIDRILTHLPTAIQPAVQFAYITGWRVPSEVLPMQWRHVDFEGRVVRLDPHTTKNDEGRTFPFTDALHALLEAQKAEHDRLKAEGIICPWVFNRTNKKVKGKRITTFIKASRAACTKAGCPGRIPHDLRRTAVRKLVRAGIPGARGDDDDGPQNAVGVPALQHRQRGGSARSGAHAERRGRSLVPSCTPASITSVIAGSPTRKL